MTSESPEPPFLETYRNISSKLKKRFLRKPNETEAAEAFAALGQQCESQKLPQYAALSWIATARCEGALGNGPSETAHLVKAARQFLEAELEDSSIGCTSISTDNLQGALACFGHAESRYVCAEEQPIALGLQLEIVQFLERINRKEEAYPFIRRAVDLSHGGQDCHVHCLDLLATHFVSSGDYVAALNTYQEMVNKLRNLPGTCLRMEIMLACEINSVFLSLILRPNPQSISPDLAKILEKYIWGDQSDDNLQACRMPEELFLLMQSLVIICQSLDTSGLQDIEGDFWPFLSARQKELLRALVKTYYH